MSTIIKKANCDSKSDRREDYMQYEPKHPIPKEILFECSPSNGAKTLMRQGQSFTAACATIDTTCIYKPKVKIEFSSIIALNVDSTNRLEVRLLFELFKVCDNRPKLSCGTWIYERIAPGRITEIIRTLTDSFSFIYCECQTCPGCCQYFVRVTADMLEPSSGEIATANISGNSIIATAV